MSLVSIVTPTYNRSKFLEKAIKSVLVQSFQDWEMIVVDDCSTDNTEEVVRSFNDTRIKYVKLEKNSGGSMKPRQVGLELSDSKYIAILDDDDFWVDETKLQKQVDYLESHLECVLVGTNSLTLNQNGSVKIYHRYPQIDNQIRNKILLYNCFYHSSVMYRRETYVKVGGYSSIRHGRYDNYSNDYDLWMRMGIVGKFVNLPIFGVGHIYLPSNLNASSRIYYMLIQMNLSKKYKNEYPNYIIANVVRFACSVVELPLLRNLKNATLRFMERRS